MQHELGAPLFKAGGAAYARPRQRESFSFWLQDDDDDEQSTRDEKRYGQDICHDRESVKSR